MIKSIKENYSLLILIKLYEFYIYIIILILKIEKSVILLFLIQIYGRSLASSSI